MTSKTKAAIGAGGTVVLGGISAALINELHGGWLWWVAAGIAVLISAVVSAWLAYGSSSQQSGDRLDRGAVKAGRDIEGGVTTKVAGAAAPSPPAAPSSGDVVGPGAVKAGRDIDGDVSTDVS